MINVPMASEIVITTKLRHYIVNLQPYFSTLESFFSQNRLTELFPSIAASMFVKFDQNRRERYRGDEVFMVRNSATADNLDVRPFNLQKTKYSKNAILPHSSFILCKSFQSSPSSTQQLGSNLTVYTCIVNDVPH